MTGPLLREPRGSDGFGYDPSSPPTTTPAPTTAEMSPAEKDAISHRGKALRPLAPARGLGRSDLGG